MSPPVSARRSRKGADTSARDDALKRLKSLREGERRSESGYQIRIEESIYDTVEEEDYKALVAKRREEDRFIADDEVEGYRDEGEEVDWSKGDLPPSSEESEGEGDKTKKKKLEKKKPPIKKPSSLLAAAALTGKHRLSAMFTSPAFKKSRDDKTNGFSVDSLVDDVIAEFAPDEADREKRRRGHLSSSVRTKGCAPIAPVKNIPVTKPELTMVKNNVAQTGSQENGDLGKQNTIREWKDEVVLCSEAASESSNELPHQVDLVTNERVDEEDPRKVIEAEVELAKRDGISLNAKIEVKKDSLLSATAAYRAELSGSNGNLGCDGGIADQSHTFEESKFELNSDGSMNFYIIDAYEFELNSDGTLYLFGKIQPPFLVLSTGSCQWHFRNSSVFRCNDSLSSTKFLNTAFDGMVPYSDSFGDSRSLNVSKVKAGSAYHSCCVVVNNMQRCVYAIPNGSVFQTNVIMDLERDVVDSRISSTVLQTKLQEMASGLKGEISKKLLDLNVSTFSMTPVKRSYAFERSEVPIGEQHVLKVSYPFKDPALPSDFKGQHVSALFGTHSSALELLLIKRKIKGPSWLSISKFSSRAREMRVSWCKFEVVVNCFKDIRTSSSFDRLEIPPVIVSAINLKTIISGKQNVNEIVSASVICCCKAKIDTPMLASEWKRPGVLSHFTVVRNLEGVFPMGFTKEVADRNSKSGSVLATESNERALLNRLMLELHKLDSDVLVGHNISGFDLDVLLHRAQALKISSNTWSKIGRLKRSKMPKLTKGSTFFGSGASPGIMSCISGRLLCDTFLCSRVLLKEVSYSLTQLSKTQLNKDRKEIPPHDIPTKFQSSGSLLELVEYGETDAWLSMELMFHLSVLPLTRQLTNISGHLWGKTLQGARSQSVEYLLLHAFHAKKYIVPDKISKREKDIMSTKRKIAHSTEGGDLEEFNNGDLFENDTQQLNQGKAKKGPSYSGGLVLEPKKGLYDKYILLLDFNSLYPSIIQEYNICFTTVERSADGLIPRLPSSKVTGVLPELLKNLVERRKMVKSWLKNATGLKLQQLDIQQQALKLTANSMYGCLGSSNARFYAKPLAELITLQGREILQSTVDLVQNNLNLEVIYGDTDSIMIYSGLDDILQAKAIAGRVIQEVNKKYQRLEIDLDGLYKRMLLLKKKKYAAVKVQYKDGVPYEMIERKGLDMVRRDWSLLSKEIGDFCLSQILSGGSCEDVVEAIHNSLIKVQEDMRNGKVSLEKYVITKSLTKPPESYPDGKSQPHVQVALRLKEGGYRVGCSAGDTIPYVICREQGVSSSSSTGIAQRARHPEELEKDNGIWIVDIDYYLAQQIHPVVSRLCASIQGTSPARLADCLGLDSSRFQVKASEAANSDPSTSMFSVNDDERYNGCDPLRFTCPTCSGIFECPPLSSLVFKSRGEIPTKSEAEKEFNFNFWRKLLCPKCPDEGDRSRISPVIIANQVKKQVDGFISLYYKSLMTCDDETCKHTTRGLNLRIIGDSERGSVCPNYPRCNGHLLRQYTEADLYKQLSYFCHVLDSERFLDKLDLKARIQAEVELDRVRPELVLAASTIQKIRDRCAYGWIQLSDLCVNV